MPGFVLMMGWAVELWRIWGAAGLNWAVDMEWMDVPLCAI